MTPGKAVFLDLQGTLGGEGLGDILSFSFFPSTFPAIRLFNDYHLPVIIITNQSHIAKGLFSLQEFEQRMDSLKQELAAYGASIDAVYCCPHSSDNRCTCRKPKPGLPLQAQKDFGLELTNCYLVGDTGAWDMALAHAIGCKGILVRTGLGESSLGAYRHLWADTTPHFVAGDISEAAQWIILQERESVLSQKTA